MRIIEDGVIERSCNGREAVILRDIHCSSELLFKKDDKVKLDSMEHGLMHEPLDVHYFKVAGKVKGWSGKCHLEHGIDFEWVSDGPVEIWVRCNDKSWHKHRE